MIDILLKNSPVLIVLIPMLASGIITIINNNRLSFLLFSLAILSSFALAFNLFLFGADIFIHYNMGGFEPPIGIGYNIDGLSIFVTIIILAIALFLLPAAPSLVGDEISKGKISLFYAVFLMCISGLVGIVLTEDIFNLYVFLEISSLATYALIAMGRKKRALIASFEYLLLGTLGATFILIGIGLIYISTGTLNMVDISIRLNDVVDLLPFEAGIAFFVVGLCLKLALFPMHIWLVNSYSYSPSFVASFLSATATKVSAYVLIRFVFSILGEGYSFTFIPLAEIILFIAASGAVIASIAACFQKDIRRILAFSSVAQISYIVLVIAYNNDASIGVAITQMMNHAFAKAGLFVITGAVIFALGDSAMIYFRGLFKRNKMLAISFVICGFSLMGIPPTAGFVSKFLLFEMLIEDKDYFVLFVVIISSLLAVIYMWRIFETMFFDEPYKNLKAKKIPVLLQVSIYIFASANIIFGLYTNLSADYAKIVGLLLGV